MRPDKLSLRDYCALRCVRTKSVRIQLQLYRIPLFSFQNDERELSFAQTNPSPIRPGSAGGWLATRVLVSGIIESRAIRFQMQEALELARTNFPRNRDAQG